MNSNNEMVLPEEIVSIIENEGFSCNGKSPNKAENIM